MSVSVADGQVYQVLARKWRPQSFADLAGLQHIAQTLQNAIRAKRVAHAFVFTGSRGVGKTSAARILAKCLNCLTGPSPEPCNQCESCVAITAGSSPDVIEIDGASNRGINEIRQLRENVGYLPQISAYKIYIIDEVHMLTTEAFNALLKTLEEPPDHVKFILATTEPHKIPITILSRCQRYDFGRLSAAVIEATIEHIAAREGWEIEPAAIQLLAREAEGSMRDALSVLDQVVAFSSGPIRVDDVRLTLGVVDSRHCFALVQALVDRQMPTALQQVMMLEKAGIDMKRFAKDFLLYLRNLVLLKLSPELEDLVEAAPEERQQIITLAKRANFSYWQQIFDLFQEQYAALLAANLPRLTFEMTLVRMGMARDLEPLETLIDRLRGMPQPAADAISPGLDVVEVHEQDPGYGREVEGQEQFRPVDFATGQPAWPAVLEALRPVVPVISSLLEDSRLLRWEGEQLEIGLPAYAYSLMRDDEKEARLCSQLQEITGISVQVTLSRLPENDPAAPAVQGKSVRSGAQQINKQAVINDDMVRCLVDTFDASIEEIRQHT
ncbi:MAG: DNA polymerase III subunit gamma/tau [Deltaproteobacteria bacterium]|nr:DNA polymerase III subunit gamma/tau [Candidatus Anaeroferrophillus wilburensis]MBN2888684.1 DNA polymerase III subunit gamma/tau [Deltaproteobacteria bacterium]